MESFMQSSAMTDLAQALFECESVDDVCLFLRDVATKAELTEMAKRWQAAKLVNKKVPYRKIAETTGLSTATITRVAAWLNEGAGGYQKALRKSHHVH